MQITLRLSTATEKCARIGHRKVHQSAGPSLSFEEIAAYRDQMIRHLDDSAQVVAGRAGGCSGGHTVRALAPGDPRPSICPGVRTVAGSSSQRRASAAARSGSIGRVATSSLRRARSTGRRRRRFPDGTKRRMLLLVGADVSR
ncbi:MAG: hypothetical protein AB7V42_10935 [Thermoleophilia bacterium]